MDYKNTLNMPNTNFEMKANLNQKEPLFQKEWLDKKIYQKVLEKNKDKPTFFLHDGPPYANGNIHVGHVLNKTLKDIIVRYKNFTGFRSEYISGWDTHGLPIEVAMIKKDENAINDSVLLRRQKCRKYALEQVANQKEQFKRLGLLSDLEKKYLTLDHNFEIEQLITFYDMVNKGLIFCALKPVYWSWSSKTSLADAEIEYADVKSDSIYFSLDLEDTDFLGPKNKLLVWTTTPWTLPSNLAVAINPNLDYCQVLIDNQKYIVAKDLVNKLSEKFKKEILILKEFNAKEIENFKYIHPIKKDKKCPVILAEYVSADNGTGLVHNAPGFGLDDYLACKNYGIDIYCPIDDDGKFTNEVEDIELSGLFYLKANPIIIQRLIQDNNLVLSEEIIHSAAHDWRTKKPVIYRATKQWFVNIEKVQNNIINSLKKDVNSPHQKNTNRMIEMIQKRKEWCISRQRVWGVPLPIIYDENQNPILDLKLISNIIHILDKKGVDHWFDSDVKEYLIEPYLSNPNIDKFSKEKDIMDVWFDSGTSYNMFKHWNINYPADLYLEGSDQYRGWFNSSLITGVIRYNHSPYKAILQHGFTLDENGFKMSKSLGNTVDPLKVFDQYGADIFRLWVASSDYTEDQRFGENILKQISEVYRKIRNTLFKYSLSTLNDFNVKTDKQPINSLENKYILTKLSQVISEINHSYEQYDFAQVIKTIYNFTQELSTWYFEYIKDPVYCYKLNNGFRREIQTTIYIILKNLLVALAPIMPHTCEEVYSHFNITNKKESVHLEDWMDTDLEINLNNELLDELNQFFQFRNLVLAELEKARNDKKIKKNNEAIITINNKYKEQFKNIDIKKWLLVADVKFNDTNDIIVEHSGYNKCLRCWSYKNDIDMHDSELCKSCYEVLK